MCGQAVPQAVRGAGVGERGVESPNAPLPLGSDCPEREKLGRACLHSAIGWLIFLLVSYVYKKRAARKKGVREGDRSLADDGG